MATKTAHTLSLDANNGANDCTTEIQKFLAGAVLALGLRAQIDGVQPWAGATHADAKKQAPTCAGIVVAFSHETEADRVAVVGLVDALVARGSSTKGPELAKLLRQVAFAKPAKTEAERSKLQAELVGLLTPPPDPTPAPIAESQPDVAEQPQEG